MMTMWSMDLSSSDHYDNAHSDENTALSMHSDNVDSIELNACSDGMSVWSDDDSTTE